jgi:transposase, IS30 family
VGSYRRVTWEDRIQIKALSQASIKAEEIGRQLGFDRSTIYRELRRNRGRKGYRPQQAQTKAEERQEWRSQPRKMVAEMVRTIEKLVRLKWSPEQISNRLEIEGRSSVSYETIYQHVYTDHKSGGTLFTHLRFGHRKRKPRFPRGKGDRRGIIKNAVSIEQRPNGANNRTHYGHWERDTMFGSDKKNSVLLMADRKSRFVRLGKLSRRTADLTLVKTKDLLKGFRYKTMTNDRGREFTDHEQLTADLKMPVFFCHPYSSSERGTVENRIGILRQYLPKGTNLKYLKHSTLQKIEDQINSRPMKCLDWKTPYEVMYGKNVALTT